MAAYILDKPFAFRGWHRLPYAILNTETGVAEFLRESHFAALSLCDGTVDIDGERVTKTHRDLILQAAQEGYVKACNRPQHLELWQEHRIYPARYIKKAFWSLTGRCNYKCKHCCLSADMVDGDEISNQQCTVIIDQLKECGITNVSLTGGEPLLRPDFFDIVDRILDSGILIKQVYSNGKLVTSNLLDAFSERNCKPVFHMSFDGQGWHDWLRGMDGAERAVLDAFTLCRERGFSTGAAMTLHRRNMHLLRDSINLLSSLGVTSLKTNPVAEVGSWLHNGGCDSLTTNEVRQLYLNYIPYFFKDGSPLNLMLGGFFRANIGSRKYTIPAMKFGGTCAAERLCVCGHARANLYISPDGRALPCMPMAGVSHMRSSFPRILDIGLAACLTDSMYMRLVDTRLSEVLAKNKECFQCKHRYHCGGGCRAAALAGGKANIMGIDVAACSFFTEGWPQRIRQKIQTEVTVDVEHPQLPSC